MEEALEPEDEDRFEDGDVLVSFVNDFAFEERGGLFEVDFTVCDSVDAFTVDVSKPADDEEDKVGFLVVDPKEKGFNEVLPVLWPSVVNIL